MAFNLESYVSSEAARLQSFGPENSDLIFYVIFRENQGSGFFSNLFHVLGHLHIAEKLGMVPVVDMKNFPTLYNEDVPVQGTTNAWEYYFKQPSAFSLEEVYRSKYVVFCDGKFKWGAYDNVLALRMLTKFICVQEYIEQLVMKFYLSTFEHKKVLGIHFRGQEQKNAPDHPSCPTVPQIIQATRELMSRHPVDIIFLVTEEQKYVDVLKDEFGAQIVHTNAFRTYDVNAYTQRPYPRDLHMYYLGLDVLCDALLLAKANYLLASGLDGIASGSNVSQIAQVWNSNAYSDIHLIYNGINKSGKSSLIQRIINRFCIRY